MRLLYEPPLNVYNVTYLIQLAAEGVGFTAHHLLSGIRIRNLYYAGGNVRIKRATGLRIYWSWDSAVVVMVMDFW